MRKHVGIVMLLIVLLGAGGMSSIGAAQSLAPAVYLPFVSLPGTSDTGNPTPVANLPIENAPYLNVASVTDSKLPEMGIFWYGKVSPDTNYTDVRIGYNDQALWVYAATFDRRIFYNESSNGSGLESWDAVTLLLNTDGAVKVQKPTVQSYQFVAQFYHWQDGTKYKAAYKGDGSQWALQPVAFTVLPGWRGDSPNNDGDDRGWVMTFQIPFSSLGLSGKPQDGTIWRMALQTHDRDTKAGPPLTDQVWPTASSRDNPTTWGQLRFGMPGYTQPSVANVRTTTLRNKLNGASVPDAAVGGGAGCGAGLDFFSQWGQANYAGKSDFNIQNQSDVADWPCFSKYYVTFPLSSIPSGKVIQSAKLVLHEFGGSDPANAKPTLIQVMRAASDWTEATLNWNNAPLVLENFAQSWVQIYTKNPIVWPGDPYNWDVSRAAGQAYQEKAPLRLVLYSADSIYHSGKYFVSSDTGDWNAEGRPTLIVNWGDPQ